ncbi:hypothetical protein DEVEQU_01016 [Devosia equisanguinis]|uniref:Uncharacterized protein n=1 Tax=Devosia equisanguinis TaxID=2490941 RepID=A0A3S4GIK2_9HYPH|nr:hypothetical protein [Devosia equisanguinis]VDS03887.1 hypothetical protein DEVEQU_01016 [Devosia equisanguinis]
MSDPKTDPKPPFFDLVDTIKEARRHAKAFQKAALRREQLQQLYTLLDHLRFLIVSDPEGKKPLPDGRSPMSLSDLILTKLASPDFSMQKVRDRIAAGRPKMGDAERAGHEQRHLDVVKAHYDYWTDPKWLAEMGMDAATIDMLKTGNSPIQRTKLLVELVKNDIKLLEQEPWQRPDGLERLHELKWYEARALDDELRISLPNLSIPSTVRRNIPPATAKLNSEKRIAERLPQRVERATDPVRELHNALLEEGASNKRQSFAYYGAAAEFDGLEVNAKIEDVVITLTACIVAARKTGKGRIASYEQDAEIFRAVLRHIRECVATGQFK